MLLQPPRKRQVTGHIDDLELLQATLEVLEADVLDANDLAVAVWELAVVEDRGLRFGQVLGPKLHFPGHVIRVLLVVIFESLETAVIGPDAKRLFSLARSCLLRVGRWLAVARAWVVAIWGATAARRTWLLCHSRLNCWKMIVDC